MTTIKLKCEIRPIESCNKCPFVQWDSVLEYGEYVGYSEGYCALTYDFIGYSDDFPDNKLDSCPVIEILSEEDP